jgi:Fe-S cluster assembly protein SufD
LDDQAQGVFNGHIYVARDSQRIAAFQNNKNILLTDKAQIHTQPHLEIYADDVKCSHGATVGQLDQEALFYMRARGIHEDIARMLLMYAFAAEVINKIKIEPLRHQIDEMVYRRLRGELGTCDHCILDCNATRTINIDIDTSKL